MKLSTKAALLSGLVFPGTGQIHLKRLRRGVAIMVCALAGIGVIVWLATVRALAILDQLQSQSAHVDMDTISNLALTSSAEMSPYGNFILVFIVCCWLFAIVDAYRIGKGLERSENNQGPGEGTLCQR